MVIYLAREYKNNFRTGKVKNFHTKEELQHFLKQSRDKGKIYRGEKPISKLQVKREEAHLSVKELAERASIERMTGCNGHMALTIKFIETGEVGCPKPRKTYEYKALAKALNCSINELID